jgi:hypothetical protein
MAKNYPPRGPRSSSKAAAEGGVMEWWSGGMVELQQNPTLQHSIAGRRTNISTGSQIFMGDATTPTYLPQI